MPKLKALTTSLAIFLFGGAVGVVGAGVSASMFMAAASIDRSAADATLYLALLEKDHLGDEESVKRIITLELKSAMAGLFAGRSDWSSRDKEKALMICKRALAIGVHACE